MFEIGPITKTEIKKFAEASQDWNSIHLDEKEAKAAGFPAEVIHGMWTMGVMTAAVTNWLGKHVEVHEFVTTFSRPLFKGDTVRVGGKVLQAPAESITIELFVKNQDDVQVSHGKVTVRGD
nr:MaoC/PaaZ C-terminal domain-containing protein [Thalassobacillus pellis]